MEVPCPRVRDARSGNAGPRFVRLCIHMYPQRHKCYEGSSGDEARGRRSTSSWSAAGTPGTARRTRRPSGAGGCCCWRRAARRARRQQLLHGRRDAGRARRARRRRDLRRRRRAARRAPCCRRTPPTSTPPTWSGSPAGRNDDRADRRRWSPRAQPTLRWLQGPRAAVPADVRAPGLPQTTRATTCSGAGSRSAAPAAARVWSSSTRRRPRRPASRSATASAATGLVTEGGRVVGVALGDDDRRVR